MQKNLWQCIADLLERGWLMIGQSFCKILAIPLPKPEPLDFELPKFQSIDGLEKDFAILAQDAWNAFQLIEHMYGRKQMGNSRFDYVAYDDAAKDLQAKAKEASQSLEAVIEKLQAGRAKSLALTKLEEVYMWIGKAVRDEQVARSDGKVELQEGRGDG